jgi:signal peptidase II
LSNTEQALLRQIDRALEKIEEKSYGICDISQESIPLARLEAIPYATMTVKMQEKSEKRAFVSWKNGSLYALAFLLLLVADFSLKLFVHLQVPPMDFASPLYPYGGFGIFRNWHGVEFAITHVMNRGVAWGLLSSMPEYILYIRLLFIGGLLGYLLFAQESRFKKTCLAMVMSGAVGNVLDYFLYGHVVDMFHFVFWGFRYPVFNIADSAIFLGITLIVAHHFLCDENSDNATENKPPMRKTAS